MCPGTEFGIIDTAAGVVFAFMTYVTWSGGIPIWHVFALSTIGWFAMGAYFFYKASKCKCMEYEAQFKKSMAEIDAIFARIKK